MKASKTNLAGVLAIALLAVTLFLGSPSTHAQGGGFVSGIEGAWLTTVTIQGGPPPFHAIATYGSGGSLVVTDSGVPPAQGNVYQGSWVRTGGNEITFTFLGFQFDATGALAGYIRAHETIRGEAGGDAYSSVTSRVEMLDVNMNVLFSGSASTHAVRIPAK